MNLNTKLSFSYPNFIWGLVILDRAWLMVLDAMILTSHKNEPQKAYLPGSKDTVIRKAVPSGRDSTIALRWSWSLRFPQMWGTREHNLWELGTAFALSPHHYSVIPSLLPHLNIAVSIWNHHFPFSSKSNFGADHNISHWCYFFSLIWTLDPIQC